MFDDFSYQFQLQRQAFQNLTNELEGYDDWRFGMSILLFLVLSGMILSNCIGFFGGVCGYDKNATPIERSKFSDLGGMSLLVGVGMSFCFSWIFMGLVMTSFSVGSHGERYFCELFATDEVINNRYIGLEFAEDILKRKKVINQTIVGSFVRNPFVEMPVVETTTADPDMDYFMNYDPDYVPPRKIQYFEHLHLNISHFINLCQNSNTSSMWNVFNTGNYTKNMMSTTTVDPDLEDEMNDRYRYRNRNRFLLDEETTTVEVPTYPPLIEIELEENLRELIELNDLNLIDGIVSESLENFTVRSKTLGLYLSIVVDRLGRIDFEAYKKLVDKYFRMKNGMGRVEVGEQDDENFEADAEHGWGGLSSF